MYGQGLIVITETGSYNRVGSTSGSDGWSVSFESTHTIYEREVFCKSLSIKRDKRGACRINVL